MNVLILHQHFNTPQKGGALRSYYLAKALVDRGIRTTVITGHNDSDYKVENIEGIEVHFLPIAYDNRFGFYQRGYSFLKYIFQSVRLARKFKDSKVCYAISVPLTIGLVAIWIKKRYKIPFIFEVGDLWPDAPVQMGFVQNYFFKQFLYALEQTIYQQAQSIVALSPMIKSAVEKKISGKAVHLIPNMADTNYYKPETKNPELVKRFGVEGKFVVSYIGALGVANGLDYYVECAWACSKINLPIHFLLCGDGAMLEHLKTVVKLHSLKNFSFIPFQTREGVHEVMNVTDASFVCYQPYPILEAGSPNKYFDGLAAGKLALINFGGWIKEEIEETRCGIFIDPKHPADFIRKIEPLLNNPDGLIRYQQAARQLAQSKYSREWLSKKFADIFNT